MSKPKVAFYWCASCGGCEEAVVDLAEDVLKVVEAVDIVFWPVALDFKRADMEAMADGDLAVSFINGAIRSSEQAEMVQLLRTKSQMVVAFGSCAHLGGIPGLANTFDREAMFREVYANVPSIDNENGTVPQPEIDVPEGKLTLPTMWNTVKTLDQVINVDYYLPGCPPPVKLIMNAVNAIVSGQLPPAKTVLAPDIALCDECDRRTTKPDKLSIKEFKRPHTSIIDSEKCLLAQGFLCLGPVTRQGCETACVKGNMPCTGCMGPTSRVHDYGTKALSAIASLADSNEKNEIEEILAKIVDPVGTFYRYSLPASLLHRSYVPSAQGGER
ncbi:MAG: oxidoreductase [Candidatus Zixiibacteriota bacterium]